MTGNILFDDFRKNFLQIALGQNLFRDTGGFLAGVCLQRELRQEKAEKDDKKL